jgi:hypothetical protein
MELAQPEIHVKGKAMDERQPAFSN